MGQKIMSCLTKRNKTKTTTPEATPEATPAEATPEATPAEATPEATPAEAQTEEVLSQHDLLPFLLQMLALAPGCRQQKCRRCQWVCRAWNLALTDFMHQS